MGEALNVENESTESKPRAATGDGDIWLPGDNEARPTRMPTPYQLSRGQWFCLLAITISLIFYGLYSARAIMFPVTLSLLIALPLRPLVRACRSTGMPNPLGALLIVAVLVVAVLSGCVMLWKPAKGWIADSKDKLEAVEQKLSRVRGPLADVQEAGKSVEKLATENQDPTTLKVEVKQPSLTSTVLSATGDILVGGTITVSLVFMLLAFGDGMLNGIVELLPKRVDRQNVLETIRDAEQTISNYLLTYTLINLVLGIIIGVGMWAIGMPNPVLWGVMAACLNYIPFLGLAVGTGVVFLVGVISFDSLGYAMLAPAIYLAANGVEANIITPMLLGRSLKLNVIVIFLFIIVWGWMWGIGGALIAVPLLIVAKVVCDHVQRLKPISRFLET